MTERLNLTRKKQLMTTHYAAHFHLCNIGRVLFRIFLFTLLIPTSIYAQNTYYIDPSYTGTTQNGAMSTPYKSWTSVTFSNGNTYLQKRGTTYSSSTQLFINGKTYVTIGAYGSGDRPKFSYTGTGHAIRIQSSANCIFQDFEVNGNVNAVSLVYVSGTSGDYTSDITINNCDLHNAHNGNNAGFGIYGFYNNGLKILYTDIHNVALDGMYLKFEPNIEIGYCNIYDINRRFFNNSNQTYSSGDGIQLDGTYDGFHIHHTTIDRTNGAGNKYSLILNSAPGLSDNAFGIIEYCTFINGSNVAEAVLIERGKGIITRYNTFKGNTGGLRLGGAYTSDNIIHNNVFYNCTKGIGIGYSYPSVGPCNGTKVYNNVFYHVTNYHIWVDKTNVVARNNIHYRTNDSGVALYNYGGGSWTLSHNCYSSAAAAGSPGTGTNPVIGNPLFIDAANYDFHLQGGSPCIDAGTHVGIQYDPDEISIPQNGIPDIGAYEYQVNTGSNQPPVINNQSFSVNENVPVNTVVGTLAATDPDEGQTLTFSIVSGNTSNAFAVHPNTGVISVNNASAINFEAIPQFVLQVSVTDNGPGFLTDQASVTIQINDVNEHPVINNQSFSVNEFSAAGTPVGNIIASDPDNGQTLTYAIVSGNTASAFALNPATGLLTVNNSSVINNQTNPEFNLVVSVTDNGAGNLSDQATITILVTEVNLPPVINNQAFIINEKSATGTLVGTVQATDPNTGQQLTYTIVSGNTGSAFQLNSSTGDLTVNSSESLNYNNNPSFNLVVKVTDNGFGNLTDQATITVNLIQEPEMSLSFNITHQTPQNSDGAIDLTVSGGFEPYTFFWNNGQSTPNELEIQSVTASGNDGNIPENVLDNDLATRWSCFGIGSWIKADLGDIRSISSVSIAWMNVVRINYFEVSVSTDGNNFSTVFSGESNPDLLPGQEIHTFTETLARYVKITVNGNSVNDWASITELDINGRNFIASSEDISELVAGIYYVDVISATGAQAGGSAEVLEIVTNHPPVITPQNFSINENSPSGMLLGTILASDPDQGQALSFSIISGNTENAFTLNAETGILSVNNSSALDYETCSTFSLIVRVTDDGEGELWSEALIVVAINDVNENPVITGQLFSINENTPENTIVGNLVATDPDAGQTLSFTIISGNTDGAFALSADGELTVANALALDFE
ncbi:MAG: cadherin domain-containing protein, partial [Lentimicrobiaceae bacterium]|nr:cadherin domain-containing protein [Lentimicrobiaceae bacterium]